MALVICNGGRLLHAAALQSYFNANTTLRLFKNNHAPVRGDTSASYTEATFGGYAPVALNAWGAPALTADWHALLIEAARTFVCVGAPLDNVIYGYFVTDGAGNLQWAELASFTMAIDAIGKAYSVLPQYTYISETGA